MNLKKKVALVLFAGVVCGSLVGCGGGQKVADPKAEAPKAGGKVFVVSREDGSGTRGAFIELFGIEKKDANGKKVDNTTDNASITNNTAVMMTTVAGNKDAIGYISLGSLNDTVKALKIDGAAATVANIQNKSYKVSRPFNVATKESIKPEAQAFLNFIMSKEGQAIVSKSGYIGNDTLPAYAPVEAKGKVIVAGSSSVTPVMEKLKEAYKKVNPNVDVEVQQSDSTTGMKSAISGVCDIGMASREVKKSELEAGLKATVIAMDGIAVIVNKANAIEGLTKEQVEGIFTGKISTFDGK